MAPPDERPPPAIGLSIAGLACALVGLLLFRVPFLALMLTCLGLLFSARAMFGYRDAPADAANIGWTMAIAGLILALIGFVPGVFITYAAAFQN